MGLKVKLDHVDKKILENILRIRLSQMVVNEEYKAGKFKIPIHLSLGHESLAVAVDAVMRDDDRLLLTHRNVAYNLARERALSPILREYCLEGDGLGRAALGSMNLMNPKRGIIYTSSILGNNFPVAAGVAFQRKNNNPEAITIVLGGDGSIEEGSFYESVLMARTLRLPLLILIENNDWSLATRICERRCDFSLKKLADSFSLRFDEFLGNDPFEYIEKLEDLKSYALKNEEPVLIQAHVATLGDWRLQVPEHPDGKFINYHAGPTPSVELKHSALLKTSNDDPVFVISKYFNENELERMTKELITQIQYEIR